MFYIRETAKHALYSTDTLFAEQSLRSAAKFKFDSPEIKPLQLWKGP